MRWVKWLPLGVVAAVCGATLWLSLASVALALRGATQLVVAARDSTVTSLVSATQSFAKSAGVAGWVARGWGTLAPVVPGLDHVAQVGERLGQVSEAGALVAPHLPALLGFEGPRNYLVTTLNDAELFGSGGAPLNAVVVRLDQGRASIPVSGSVSLALNPGNAPYAWTIEGGEPWYRDGKQYPFANSDFHPDFTVSGRNLVAAWNGLGHEQVDGVITVDVKAVAAVLEAVGPLQTEAFGEVTAANIVEKILVQAYRDYPDWPIESLLARQEANSTLQSALIDRVKEPGMAIKAARALWDVLPSRHVQIYLSDPELQSALATLGIDGALQQPGPQDDVLGVFLQSAPSKLAIFQEQEISRDVTIRPDGSASVRQSVTFTNAVPDDLEGERKAIRGYLALTYRQRVAFRIPSAAIDPRVEVVDREPLVEATQTGPFSDDVGASVMWQGQDIPPGESSTSLVTYDLPSGTFTADDGLQYTLLTDPQPMTHAPNVVLTVTFPEGSSASADADGWSVDGNTATWTGQLDRARTLRADG